LVAAHKAEVPVVLVDSSQASLDKGLKFADKLLEKDISKQKITREQADVVKSRLTTTTTMDALSDVDFVIEAIPVSFLVEATERASSNYGHRRYQISSAASSPS